MLRHQLNVLRRRVPSSPKLVVADRLLFVWLYRLFPSVLDAVANQTGYDCSVASDGVSTVLALEVAPSRRSAEDTRGDPAPDPGDEPGQPAVGRPAYPW